MKFALWCVVAMVLFMGGFAPAADKPAADKPAADKPATDKPTTQPTAPATPVNKKCPISGDDVNAKSKTVTYKGKVVGFCCDDCVDLFNKDPDKYADKIK